MRTPSQTTNPAAIPFNEAMRQLNLVQGHWLNKGDQDAVAKYLYHAASNGGKHPPVVTPDILAHTANLMTTHMPQLRAANAFASHYGTDPLGVVNKQISDLQPTVEATNRLLGSGHPKSAYVNDLMKGLVAKSNALKYGNPRGPVDNQAGLGTATTSLGDQITNVRSRIQQSANPQEKAQLNAQLTVLLNRQRNVRPAPAAPVAHRDPNHQMVSPADVQHALNYGSTSVSLKEDPRLSIGLPQAQQIMNAAGRHMQTSSFTPDQQEQAFELPPNLIPDVPMDKTPRKMLAGQTQTGTPAHYTTGAEFLKQGYQDLTHLTPEDAPYAYTALGHVGAAIDPLGTFGNTAMALQNNPRKAVTDYLNGLNFVDPKLTGPQRFDKALNFVFALDGASKNVGAARNFLDADTQTIGDPYSFSNSMDRG